MPAFNESSAVEQIKNIQQTAKKATSLLSLIFQTKENQEVVNQNWNNLATDFPNLVDGTTQDDPVILDGVVQDFSSSHIRKCMQAFDEIYDVLQGTQTAASTGNKGRDIRRLTDGIV